MLKPGMAIAAAVLLAVHCRCSAAPGPVYADHGRANVSLQVEPYCSLSLKDAVLVMTPTVDKTMLVDTNYDEDVSASTFVLARCNFVAVLKAPKSIPLTCKDRTFSVGATVRLVGAAGLSQDENNWYLTLNPGEYSDAHQPIDLAVSKSKNWNLAEDRAGTYTGTITLELSPK